MKKIFIVVTLVIGLFFITGCNNESDKPKYSEPKEITYEEYTTKITNKDTFAILLWQTGCSHCEEFEPTLNKVIKKYDLEVYSMNIVDFDDTEYAKLKNKTFIGGTPTVVYFKDGVTQPEKIVGSESEEDVINFFKKYGYIGD